MIILGVDPGLKATGYAVIAIDGKGAIRPLEIGSIEPRIRDVIENKLFKIHKHLSDIIDRQKPAVMVVEKLYSHYEHPTTLGILGHVRGVICLVCAQSGVKLVEESPKRVRKSVVGNGNATKEQTRRVVSGFLKIDPSKLTLDASDAAALALAYANMRRFNNS